VFDNQTTPKGHMTSKLVFENLWTVKDLAEYLRVEKKTIYDWVHKREIPFQKVNRLVRFRPKEVEAWLSSKNKE
jgi:excisionase family DNA binding protein